MWKTHAQTVCGVDGTRNRKGEKKKKVATTTPNARPIDNTYRYDPFIIRPLVSEIPPPVPFAADDDSRARTGLPIDRQQINISVPKYILHWPPRQTSVRPMIHLTSWIEKITKISPTYMLKNEPLKNYYFFNANHLLSCAYYELKFIYFFFFYRNIINIPLWLHS